MAADVYPRAAVVDRVSATVRQKPQYGWEEAHDVCVASAVVFELAAVRGDGSDNVRQELAVVGEAAADVYPFTAVAKLELANVCALAAVVQTEPDAKSIHFDALREAWCVGAKKRPHRHL